jgi:hypothetical protein
MLITKLILEQIIQEELDLVLEYEQYVDEEGNIYDDEGNVTPMGREFGRKYGGQTYGSRPPWGSLPRRRSSYSRPRPARKTSYVGADVLSGKIAALESALRKKHNEFILSILKQLKKGRTLSIKQREIVLKFLKRHSPEDLKVFDGPPISESHLPDSKRLLVTRRQLSLLVKESLNDGTTPVLTESELNEIAAIIATIGKSVMGALGGLLKKGLTAVGEKIASDPKLMKTVAGLVDKATEKMPEVKKYLDSVGIDLQNPDPKKFSAVLQAPPSEIKSSFEKIFQGAERQVEKAEECQCPTLDDMKKEKIE